MTKSLYDFSVRTIDGQPKSLSDYRGKVLLIVNVASECGYTPQYKGLEELNKQYREKGLRVLGFPCNDFGAQEPGSEAEIKEFCTTKYGASFDMFSKVSVKGDATDPLFDYLQSEESNPKYGGAIKWNFYKVLVGKDGAIVGRFAHKAEPTGVEVKNAIEKALAE
jgi:glutathione peroxidase